MPTLKESILAAIEEERVQMHSSLYFRAKLVGGVMLGLLVLVALVYLGSFLQFVWHATGAGLLLQFGWEGVVTLFSGLPWLLLIAAMIVLVAAIHFVLRFTPGYRRPVIWTALGVIVFTLIGSTMVRHTSLHERWHRVSESNNWPFVQTLYHYHHVSVQPNFTIGTVEQTTTLGFSLRVSPDRVIEVMMDEHTRFPGGHALAVGQRVGVLGERHQEPILARGIVTVSNPAVGQWYDDVLD